MEITTIGLDLAKNLFQVHGGQTLIAPSQVFVQFAPLRLSPSDRHAGQAVQLVGAVFQDLVKRQAQRARAVGHGDAKLQQQAPDAVHAGGAIRLHAFAQSMHAQQALLLDALGRDEAHCSQSLGWQARAHTRHSEQLHFASADWGVWAW